MQETIAGLEFLKQVPLIKLSKALDIQEQVFDELRIDKKRRRQPRCYLKHFVDWANQQNLIKEETKANQLDFYQLKRPNGQRKNYHIKMTQRIGKPLAFALGVVEGDFINKVLQTELNEFEYFQIKELNRGSAATLMKCKKECSWFLGWLHRYKNIPLNELRLASLIPVIELQEKAENFSNSQDYLIACLKTQQKADEVAKEVVNLIKEHYEWRVDPEGMGLGDRTKISILDTVIAIAKFQYRKQTDKAKARNYEDIPVVKYLKVYQAELRDKLDPHQSAVPYQDKVISWKEVIEALERARKEADLKDCTFYSKVEEKYGRERRTIGAIANSLQRFLMLAFFTLIPPDRQRTFRELRLGRTLKHGIFQGEKFIPKDQMADPCQARWYIHQQHGEYKTSKTYGEWTGELPDTVFIKDGKSFYQYLERWFYKGYQDEQGIWYGLRDVLKPNDDYCFTDLLGRPFNGTLFGKRIRNIFIKFTGVPVTAHMLRHIFRTHLEDIGASRTEIESAAYWMKHSSTTALKYTHQSMFKKLGPASKLTSSINKNILEEINWEQN